MKRTANETHNQTLTRLIGALDKQQPVTITYRKADGSETVRTIEIFDITVSLAGDILIAAMDRETAEARHFRLDRIQAYTAHRSVYAVTRETHTEDAPVKRTPQGIATVTVLYPVDAPINERIVLLADQLAA